MRHGQVNSQLGILGMHQKVFVSLQEEYLMNLKKRLYGLKVGQKISLGYALALGIAVSGTIAGFVVGNYYRHQAKERQALVRDEVELLHRLQSRVLQTRTHQQQLIPLVQNPEGFQDEYAHLSKHKKEIQIIWAKLKTFVAESPGGKNLPHHAQMRTLLQTYEQVPQRYSQEVDQRVAQIEQLDLAQPTDIERAQTLMLEFTNSDLALKFDGISDDLVSLLDQSYQELKTANESVEKAGNVSEQVVILSILLSVAIAALLALLTSQAIARPIQTLTQIAQRSTEESNFDLEAKISQTDEIGTLANAFNQLIYSVKHLLSEQQAANAQLETYNQTLEAQVKQRTQQIDQKNAQLEKVLDDLQRANARQQAANAQLETYNQTLEAQVEQRTQQINQKNMRLKKVLGELQRTHVQMVQSEKMSALGKMVAGVAHEINNPVNFIHGNLTHVQEYIDNLLDLVNLYQTSRGSTPEIQGVEAEIDLEFVKVDLPKILNSMKIGTDRIRQIVLSLRNFSRIDEAEFK
ncbi:MAG: histidine kinase dimerization/phospho-acceptor domain-containing protein, partial [Cyanobacteriota bacterium]|nr:histidine kinase dimerization/phospho-acceptor domain-containing protein [Cyanobacteriota bacterium]